MIAKVDIHAGAVFRHIMKPDLTITIIHKVNNKWLCIYNKGGSKLWSQTHIRKYYTYNDNNDKAI